MQSQCCLLSPGELPQSCFGRRSPETSLADPPLPNAYRQSSSELAQSPRRALQERFWLGRSKIVLLCGRQASFSNLVTGLGIL